MSEGDGTRVGVVGGDDDREARLEEAITEAGWRPVSAPAAEVVSADPTFVLAVGERAFLEVARTGTDVPILPIDAGRGVRSVPNAVASAAVQRDIEADWSTETHPLLAVAVDGDRRGTAVMDVTTMTAEAAHISEYDVATGDATLGRIRADGIVVATPAGTPGYARRIGAPVTSPGSGVVVAPIAPFATDPDHWVVDPTPVRIGQTRTDAGVELVVDDAVVASLEPDETVTCRVDGHVRTILVPESRSRYES